MEEEYTVCINVRFLASDLEHAKRRARLLATTLAGTFPDFVESAEQDDLEPVVD